jgi:hypothetical protein
VAHALQASANSLQAKAKAMITCIAAATIALTSLSGIPASATHVEAEARALNRATAVTDQFITDLQAFSQDAMALSDSLRADGVTQDLPCIFRGISQDTQTRIAEFQSANSDTARRMAFEDLHALLSDAILIAPMAASAAADAEAHPQAAAQAISPASAPTTPGAAAATTPRR